MHVIGANLMSAFTERDKVVRPITIATCGINTLRISCDVKKTEACATASGNESGSSAITGQPSCLAKA
ncbi:unannotated protein [freshwater metagenome]|uniref:Unannotated protein n=1 Tax=freshwater metagenome TaxID=449393 RepID=A0A6J7VLX0_9ZZZZ